MYLIKLESRTPPSCSQHGFVSLVHQRQIKSVTFRLLTGMQSGVAFEDQR